MLGIFLILMQTSASYKLYTLVSTKKAYMTSLLTKHFNTLGFTVFLFLSHSIAFAADANKPTLLEQLLPFALIFFVFYFLIIRPQTNKQKKQLSFINQLQKGDKIITASGILGTIEGLSQGFVTLEIAPQTKIKILKSQIQSSQDDVFKKEIKK